LNPETAIELNRRKQSKRSSRTLHINPINHRLEFHPCGRVTLHFEFKSSALSVIMRHVLLNPREGYLPLSFELEDVDSPEEFVWRVTKELLGCDQTRAFLFRAKKLPTAIGDWVKNTFVVSPARSRHERILLPP
jgi:hypothetical protein